MDITIWEGGEAIEITIDLGTGDDDSQEFSSLNEFREWIAPTAPEAER